MSRRGSALNAPLARRGRVWEGVDCLPIGGMQGASPGKFLLFEVRKSAFWCILGDHCAMIGVLLILLLIYIHF